MSFVGMSRNIGLGVMWEKLCESCALCGALVEPSCEESEGALALGLSPEGTLYVAAAKNSVCEKSSSGASSVSALRTVQMCDSASSQYCRSFLMT